MPVTMAGWFNKREEGVLDASAHALDLPQRLV
jgi:hypothetical protein